MPVLLSVILFAAATYERVSSVALMRISVALLSLSETTMAYVVPSLALNMSTS